MDNLAQLTARSRERLAEWKAWNAKPIEERVGDGYDQRTASFLGSFSELLDMLVEELDHSPRVLPEVAPAPTHPRQHLPRHARPAATVLGARFDG